MCLGFLTKNPTEWQDSDLIQFIKELRKKLPVNIIENIIQEGYKLAEY